MELNKKSVSKNCAIKCQDCSISQLCIPVSLNAEEMGKLDDIIERKKPLHKGDYLFEAGQPLRSIYAVRSGSFKSYTLTESGEEQITGFHLAGDIVGFDGISTMSHKSYAQAMETAMVCEIPFTTLDDLSGKLPKLRHQVMRMMSNEINYDQEMLLMLNKKTAEERLAAFLANLSTRFGERGFSKKEFRLTMTRGEIGNYLGLTVETISRLLSRFQKAEIIKVEGKFITILDADELFKVASIKS
ncbi:MAG: FNR family transcription factor [Pseudoalteromonas spongiae]|uniref:FNR family transcription factor n=1 Tax=Pseudoalteromonas TaxID=53246 RepID=UPI00026CA3FD|nr:MULTISPECIES: FNR family transcription factor [Pseudoalteromonas]MEC8326026.1 FNR family transcription factor [Pseudomonadota bacterium]ATC98571.1 CRP/FNR family transcriptional regulator, anaerobic regulatory protein [Pseudoalteromonas spongiae UST010723-006]KPV95257.1 Fumarate and nitrate reduction regulatory protein [Pseudoalteromonas sp. P1-9]MCF6455385.1 FNR family transcription factor [Pseudoalteromonas sp. MMG024]TMO86338.1 transcriptional regulator FNR [Pseudoalteromonas spongiae]